MIAILNINTTTFSIDGVSYIKNFTGVVKGTSLKIVNVYDANLVLQDFTIYSQYTVGGVGYASAIALQSALLDVLFYRSVPSGAGETLQSIGTLISSATEKTVPIDADLFSFTDSLATNILRKITWANFKALFQAILVSGTNIKTINSTTLLGSGNIAITPNADHTGDVTGATALTIAADKVLHGMIGVEFKSISAIGASNVDWSLAKVYTKTLTANTTLTFSNLRVGVKNLEISGNFTLALPTGFKLISAGYVGTGAVMNFIQIVCTNSSTPTGWVVISQQAV